MIIKKQRLVVLVLAIFILSCENQSLNSPISNPTLNPLNQSPVANSVVTYLVPNPAGGVYHELPGVSGDTEGGGVALGDINGNGILDMFLMSNDIGHPTNEFRYYVAYDLNPAGEPASISPTKYIPGLGDSAEGAGIAIGDIDRNGVLDILLMHYDNPSGANQFRYKIGFNLNSNGDAASWGSPIYVAGLGSEAQGANVALYDIDRDGFLDLTLMAYDNPSGLNNFRYIVGSRLYTSGNASSWSPMVQISGLGDEGSGAAIGVYKPYFIPGLPDTKTNMILMAYDNPSGLNSFRWMHFCNFDTGNGFPNNCYGTNTTSGVGNDGGGAGIAFGDIDHDLYPDMVLMAIDAAPGINNYRYKIGFHLYPEPTSWY